jgi:transcriptional regulator with XRE-family HTH domain
VSRKQTAVVEPPYYADLADYLEKTGTTHERLAQRLGLSRSYVTLLANRNRQPGLGLAIRIAGLTGIPLASLVTRAA